ncbi:kallikrein-13-like isoform X1 [Tachyglossus aculeatus]|uniref:kallikrein-13-like isoform X1 n=1 Tax=Tachyglossus aculeatus TaxID=9261 RepID=UPI0018F419D0|nr:kallikrein-13-like isoform X1 [Tachyglossus aculeatus]
MWLALALTLAASAAASQEFPKILNGSVAGGQSLPGGYTCAPHSQPWQAALMEGGTLRCGATVIHRLWVLTAAHCYRKNYTVLLGKHNLTGEQEPGQQSRWVQRSVPHPSYQSSPTHHNHDHDIMLLRLSRPIKFSNTIRPLALATDNGLPPGTPCLVSGWGSTTSPEVNYPNSLQCADIQLRSDVECHQVYPGRVTPNMLCAGTQEGGKDSCEGDSGGPLVCNGRLQGIISWGDFPCGQPNRPGVYTRVPRYLKWISDTIGRD